jgi:4'-phosphopantetheinyl transferase
VNELAVIALEDIALEHECALALVLPFPPLATASAGPARRQATRAVLRSILAGLLGVAPASLRFERSEHGKPGLAGAGGIAFNVSHAKSHSLIALSRAGDIGCDIEDRFTDEDVSGFGPLILHPRELDAMQALAAQDRVEAFRRYWVRKEAVLKAAGSGFLAEPRALFTGQDDGHATWSVEGPAAFAIHNRRIGRDCLAAVAGMDPACAWRVLAPLPAVGVFDA